MASSLSRLRAFRAPRNSPLSLSLPVRTVTTNSQARTPQRTSSSALLGDILRGSADSSNSNGNGNGSGQGNTPSNRQPRSAIANRLSKTVRDYRSGIQAADNAARNAEISRTMRRVWKAGDVYAPHDLSAAEARKWRRRSAPSSDVFDQLNINPMDEWKNVAMMYEFQTSMGRIRHSNSTGLRPFNQRKIAKAIRRGIGMGFLPSTYAHPEILRRTRQGINYNVR